MNNRIIYPSTIISLIFLAWVVMQFVRLYQVNTGGFQHYRMVYNFSGIQGDGLRPCDTPIESDSTLYGTTLYGGTYYKGIIFSYDITLDKEKTLFSFGNTYDGANPHGSLIQSGSTLYGMTTKGGIKGLGIIFSYNINTGTENILHSFAGKPFDGATPLGSLIKAGSILYGLTCNGGIKNAGTIFSYNLDTNTETILHSFAGGPLDGALPCGSLINSSPVFYGLTLKGGINKMGTIFAYNIETGTEQILHSFTGGSQDGALPFGSLIKSKSILYGLTAAGGTHAFGTLFDYDVNNQMETVLHSFAGGPRDGTNPNGSLLEIDTILYGTTRNGGNNDEGIIFAYDVNTGLEKVLYSFANDPINPSGLSASMYGANPVDSLIESGSVLYGTAMKGGLNTGGLIFSYTLPQ